MAKSFGILLGIAATVVSVNSPADDNVQAVALADLHGYARPAVEQVTLTAESASSTSRTDEPSNAWLGAIGFLGLVVLRRTRASPLA
jgi:MYXO-CTERM domain-containing protein